jgi:hypothetical protein
MDWALKVTSLSDYCVPQGMECVASYAEENRQNTQT